MGWLFKLGQTRAELIAHRTQNWENAHVKAVCLRHCLVGNILWSVWEQTIKAEDRTDRYIVCDLLQYQRDYGWGYKDMEESCGPYYYSCPLSYLEMTPVANENWREVVRAHHQRKAERREQRKAARSRMALA